MLVVSYAALFLLPAAWADNCSTYYAGLPPSTPKAASWCNEGSYFSFTSGYNEDHPVQVFYHCSDDGSSKKPTMVLSHGWPTQSFDFRNLSMILEDKFRICGIDYPGFGFSGMEN